MILFLSCVKKAEFVSIRHLSSFALFFVVHFYSFTEWSSANELLLHLQPPYYLIFYVLRRGARIKKMQIFTFLVTLHFPLRFHLQCKLVMVFRRNSKYLDILHMRTWYKNNFAALQKCTYSFYFIWSCLGQVNIPDKCHCIGKKYTKFDRNNA